MKLLVDFQALATGAAAALKPVVAMFAAAGLDTIDAASDGRTRRTAGVSFREAVLTFKDSQKVTLRVKQTGDVYQALVNGKAVAVAQQDNAKKAVAELAGMLDNGRARFQKRLAALAMKPPEGAKTAAPKLREALTAQVAELDAQIVSAKDELAALRTRA